MEYICLLRVSKEEENVVVVDGEMNVEGVTGELRKVLNLGLECYAGTHFNLLLFAPGLLKYSTFVESISEEQKKLFLK